MLSENEERRPAGGGVHSNKKASVTRDGLRRDRLERKGFGFCAHCDVAFAGPWSLANAAKHARAFGHDVLAEYSTVIRYRGSKNPSKS